MSETENSQDERRPAELKSPLVFSLREGWYVERTLHDPLENEEFAEVLKAQHFQVWADFGGGEHGVGITVYQRRAYRPPFVVEVNASRSPAGTRDYVWVDDLPSVMALLRDWIPVLQMSNDTFHLTELGRSVKGFM